MSSPSSLFIAFVFIFWKAEVSWFVFQQTPPPIVVVVVSNNPVPRGGTSRGYHRPCQPWLVFRRLPRLAQLISGMQVASATTSAPGGWLGAPQTLPRFPCSPLLFLPLARTLPAPSWCHPPGPPPAGSTTCLKVNALTLCTATEMHSVVRILADDCCWLLLSAALCFRPCHACETRRMYAVSPTNL